MSRTAPAISEPDVPPQGEVGEVTACRALWCAVIAETWRQVFKPQYIDRPFERQASFNWFGTQDFFAVCALAGIDGDCLLEEFRRRAGEVRV